MNEKRLDCCVVRDLLPSYLEELTEEGTAAQVKEHLDACLDCRQREQDMRRTVPVEKHEKKELHFLKRLKKTRLLGAALSLVITLGVMWLLYDSEFCYKDTNAGRQEAVEDYIPDAKGYSLSYGVKEGTPVHAAMYGKQGNTTLVFYMAENEENTHGFLQLEPGINGKFRAVQASYSPSQYSSGIYSGTLPGRRTTDWPKRLYYYAGYNCRDIYRAQVEFLGSYGNETVTVTKNIYPRGREFIIFQTLSEFALKLGLPEEGIGNITMGKVTLYDAEGNDITADYYNEAIDTSWKRSRSTEDISGLYTLMAIAAAMGGFFVSYFLRRD